MAAAAVVLLRWGCASPACRVQMVSCRVWAVGSGACGGGGVWSAGLAMKMGSHVWFVGQHRCSVLARQSCQQQRDSNWWGGLDGSWWGGVRDVCC
jgi:hypothetical protein